MTQVTNFDARYRQYICLTGWLWCSYPNNHFKSKYGQGGEHPFPVKTGDLCAEMPFDLKGSYVVVDGATTYKTYPIGQAPAAGVTTEAIPAAAAPGLPAPGLRGAADGAAVSE